MDKEAFEKLRQTFEDSVYPEEFLRQYEMLECLSASKDAETLLVKSRDTELPYIAKCYFADSPLFSRAEAGSIQSISHPMLPHFFAEFSNEAVRCILREYIPGQTLDEYCASRALSENEVRDIALQLCEQLQYLHSLTPPVIHRDIKPQNVIMREDGSVSLIDFGISQPYEENSKTETVAFGTKGFAPPEQYGFARPDARSDIYSLGVLMQWLLNGTTAPIQSPATPLEQVIAKCMSFDPKRRYTDISALRRALKRAQRGRRIVSIVGITAVVIAFLCAIGLLLPRQNHAQPELQEAATEYEALGFQDEIVYQAARASLGLEETAHLTADDLKNVEAIYIVGDEVFATSKEFYDGIQAWYQTNRLSYTLKTLNDLSLMPNLKEVCIIGKNISDISAVSGLVELEKIEIKHNHVTDISALAGLSCLTSVGINDNPITDLSPLISCPNLRFLDLCDMNGYDASIFAQLGDFTYLDISNQTASYQHLAGKTISELRIAWSRMDSLSYLDGVSGIEALEINNCKVTDLTPLLNHPELRTLNIKGLDLEDLGILLELPKLERVVIGPGLEEKAAALGDCPFEIVVE